MEKARFDDAYMSRLIRTFTHDLRNPLVNMQALTCQMQDALDEFRQDTGAVPVAEEMDESLAMMSATVDRMNNLVQGAYELYRAIYSEPACGWVALSTVVAEEVEKRQPALLQNNVSVQADELPAVWGDVAAVQRIVAELLDNAIRYAPEGNGKIVVAVRQTDDSSCLMVQNNGPAVAEASRERIFEPFYTTEPERRGLGLAMVEALAQAQGGRAWCESDAQGGVAFVVEMPQEAQRSRRKKV